MTTQMTTWQPPQAKIIRRVVTGAGIFAVVAVAALVIKKTVPTMIDAFDLLTKLTSSMIYTVATVAVLAAVLYLINDMFSSSGKINKLFAHSYAMAFNKLTWYLIDIDPLTPFYERQTEVRTQLGVLQGAAGQLDGIVSRFKETSINYRNLATKHEREAMAANSKRATEPRYEVTFATASAAHSRCRDTAIEFEQMFERLQPVRKRVADAMQAAEILDKNLALEIQIARDKWDASKAFSAVNKAGRAIFNATEKSALADKSLQVIEMQYADQLGMLDNLTTITQPMIDSIDLEKATASDELLRKWEQESTKFIESPRPVSVEIGKAYDSLVR